MNQFKMVAPMNKHFKGNKISYIYIYYIVFSFFLEIGIWNQVEIFLSLANLGCRFAKLLSDEKKYRESKSPRPRTNY